MKIMRRDINRPKVYYPNCLGLRRDNAVLTLKQAFDHEKLSFRYGNPILLRFFQWSSVCDSSLAQVYQCAHAGVGDEVYCPPAAGRRLTAFTLTSLRSVRAAMPPWKFLHTSTSQWRHLQGAATQRGIGLSR